MYCAVFVCEAKITKMMYEKPLKRNPNRDETETLGARLLAGQCCAEQSERRYYGDEEK